MIRRAVYAGAAVRRARVPLLRRRSSIGQRARGPWPRARRAPPRLTVSSHGDRPTAACPRALPRPGVYVVAASPPRTHSPGGSHRCALLVTGGQELRDRPPRAGAPCRRAENSLSRSYVLATLRALRLDWDLPWQRPAAIRDTQDYCKPQGRGSHDYTPGHHYPTTGCPQ